MLTTFPAGWPQPRCDAFNALLDAIAAYVAYDAALSKLAITDAVLLQRRTELGHLITDVLGPAFRNA